MNVLSGKALEVQSSFRDNGAPIQQSDYVGGWSQQWLLIPLLDGSFEIKSGNTGKVLDVRLGSTSNGGLIQ